MIEKSKVDKILALLDENYPDTKCYLNYNDTLQLLISTILSAQCTDERVNMITPALFEKYKTVEDFQSANIEDVENLIRSTGFFHTKSRNIIDSCNKIILDFNGEVPNNIEDLTSLPGVGRKTANVILGNIFNIPSIVVDTHVKRISIKLGLTKNTQPDKIEMDLMQILPKANWIRFNTQIIAHGRNVCIAKKPKCSECFLNQLCNHNLKKIKL